MRARILAAFAAAALIATALSGCVVAGSYVKKAEDKLSADNVEQVYDKVISSWNDLYVAAQNACEVSSAGADHEDGDPTLIESPALAYNATYRKQVSTYNATMHDVFKAGFVGPHGYPRTVPVVTGNDYCGIVDKLDALKAEAER
jgi:hypothetical protein